MRRLPARASFRYAAVDDDRAVYIHRPFRHPAVIEPDLLVTENLVLCEPTHSAEMAAVAKDDAGRLGVHPGRRKDRAQTFRIGNLSAVEHRIGINVHRSRDRASRDLRAGPSQTKQEFDRRRAGIGATLRTGPWLLSGEWITAKGMIYHGSDGGTIPGRPSNDGSLISGYNVLPASHADGWYVDLGYRVSEPFDLRLRYDVLNRGTDSPETEVKFQGLTIGGSYLFSPAAQLLFDVQFRRYSAPRQSGGSTTNLLLEGVDDRIGLRFIYRLGMTR